MNPTHEAPAATKTFTSEQLEQALQQVNLSADEAEAVYQHGYVLYQSGKYDEAKGIFDLLSYVVPAEPKYALAAAICWRRVGDYEYAIHALSEALEIHPQHEALSFQLAECLTLAGRRAEAVEKLKEVAAAAAGREGGAKTADRARALAELLTAAAS